MKTKYEKFENSKCHKNMLQNIAFRIHVCVKRIFARSILKTDKKKTFKIGGPLIEGYPLFSRNWQQGRSMRGTFNWQLFVEAARPTP